MKQLSGLDASFLYLETAEMPMHVGALHVFELPAGYDGDFAADMREHIATRLPLVPALRRKLAWMPLNLAAPHRAHRVDLNDLDWLVRELDRYWPRRHLRVFVDEFGWNTEHAAGGWLYVVSRAKQAADLPKAYRLAAKVGRVDTLCWFQLFDSPAEKRGDQWWNWTSGLRTYEGVKKPSWSAFARVSRGPSRLA